MVYRVFVEKKKELANEARSLFNDAVTLLGIKNLTDVRVINRYDAENITEELFDYAKKTVFSEPQLDIVSDDVDLSGTNAFAVEYLPGQFDQRADSAAQCIQIISQGERPTIRTAKVYALYGELSDSEIADIKNTSSTPLKQEKPVLKNPKPLQLNITFPQKLRLSKASVSLRGKKSKLLLKNTALQWTPTTFSSARNISAAKTATPPLPKSA